MKNSNSEKLHIVGKVSNSIIKKIEGTSRTSSKDVWLFVGYCFKDFPVGSVFDILIEEGTRNWNHDFKITLNEIYDEFGRSYKSIQIGYKTICSFECTPAIPGIIKSLPTLKTWQFGKSGIYLCNHSSINLLQSPLENDLIFAALTKLLFSNLESLNKKIFTVNEISHILPEESFELIIDNLLIEGKLKKGKNQDELILANQD